MASVERAVGYIIFDLVSCGVTRKCTTSSTSSIWRRHSFLLLHWINEIYPFKAFSKETVFVKHFRFQIYIEHSKNILINIFCINFQLIYASRCLVIGQCTKNFSYLIAWSMGWLDGMLLWWEWCDADPWWFKWFKGCEDGWWEWCEWWECGLWFTPWWSAPPTPFQSAITIITLKQNTPFG